jgi:hypothetical protein
MTRFFIPGNTEDRSEQVYAWIIRYVKAMLDCDINPARIFSLAYTYEGQQFKATVGDVDPRTGQLVVAILRSENFLICTPYYGVRRGEPIPIHPDEAIEVQYFEGLDNARETLKVAVTALDAGGGRAKARLYSAAVAIAPLDINDFPPTKAGDFLSLKHKLGWRGNQRYTIDLMSKAETEDAASAIKALYVDVLTSGADPETDG